MKNFQFFFQQVFFFCQVLHRRDDILRILKHLFDLIKQAELPAHMSFRTLARDRLDPTHARSNRTFGKYPEQSNITSSRYVGPSAKLY